MLRRRKLAILSVAVSALALLTASAQAAVRQPIVLPGLGGPTDGAMASAINSEGVVVGAAEVAHGTWHAAVWKEGVAHDLGTLGGRSSQAEDIDDQGRIVGTSQVADGNFHAFVWEAGEMKDLGIADGVFSSIAYAASDGRIVGEYNVTGIPLTGSRAFVWQDGRRTDIDVEQGSEARDVNARGQVAGTSRMRDFVDPENRGRAFIWEDGVARELGNLGGAYSQAFGINNAGHIVGQATTKEDELTSFFWDGTTMHRLPSPSQSFPQAEEINDSDVIVGAFGASSHAVVWETPESEPSRLPPPDGAPDCADAVDINNQGTIAGLTCFVTDGDFFLRPVIWPAAGQDT